MLNIGIIGCGSWAQKVFNEINRHKNFNLKSIVCRKNNPVFKNIKIYTNIAEIINDNAIDCIFVAADPKTNLEVIKLSKKNRTPLILEKPLSNSSIEFSELDNIIIRNRMIVYPNLTNYFAETFQKFKKLTVENINLIKRIIIYEGNIGPFRKNIHPIWDWGFHPISILFLLFPNNEFGNVKKKEIKLNYELGNGFVTRFDFNIDKKFNVNIVTGNLFKKKIRKIKIILQNDDFIENDLISHKLYLNNSNILSISETPISSLLSSFELSIISGDYKISKELIKASSKTIKFLEKFYKC